MVVRIITAYIKKFIVVFGSFLLFLLFFANVENVKSSINESIRFCVFSLVPSIFIFMIISSFLLYSSAFSDFSRLLSKDAISKLGVCRKYFFIILLCSLCGFVSGPKLICEDYKKNGGNKVAFSNAIILSSNAGFGFLISCVGVTIWNDIWLGVFLYLFQILSALFLGKTILKKPQFFSDESEAEEKSVSLSNAFTRAVTTSCSTVISICAFVVVFSCFTSVILNVVGIKEDSIWFAIISALFEFCKGSFLVFNTKSLLLSAFMSGFCVGFGGTCVHFQTFAVCEEYPLKKLQFVLFKAIHGVLCGFFCVTYIIIKNFLL